MPQKKRYLKGLCQQPGCTKRAIHLRGTADVRVAWISYIIKAFCGEHTREWDKRKLAWAEGLEPDNPKHMFPSSAMVTYELKAERLAAEQEALEKAERNHRRRPPTPTADSIKAHNARQPKVVRLN